MTVCLLALQFVYEKPARCLLAVQNLRDAQVKWCKLRDLKEWSSSTAPTCYVLNVATGDTVARISYNGRLWEPATEGKEIIP